jgi:malto-oligosyltrehalose synthase/4-alpha-glucanotransferase
MHNPIATYRIQFNKDFTFKHLKAIIPYLQQLGIGTLYASPIFEATPGSTHGYDVVDPLRINPEIGTMEELEAISKMLKKHNIGWLQDIVPNHMAYHPNNHWLMDVLEKGIQSAYVNFFDIDWSTPIYNGRVMVPFLGVPFEEALSEKQISVSVSDTGFAFVYGGQFYPLNIHAYITILQTNYEPNEAIGNIFNQARELQQIDNDEAFNLRFKELKEQIISLNKQGSTKHLLQACIDKVNADAALLKQISDEQYYQLCFWQETEKQVNFRRFFTVNGLICLNMQIPQVFDKCHELVKTLLDKDIIQGLRIDHIDGLYDPADYLQRLREFAGPETYIVVEKILEDGEEFPSAWPVQGSTGYDFLAMANNLLTQTESKKAFASFYRELTNDTVPVAKAILKKKSLILYGHMAGELQNLYQLFCDLELADAEAIKENNFKLIIAEFLIRCPVYRYYGNSLPLPDDEQKAIKTIFKNITDAKPELQQVTNLLKDILLKPATLDYGERVLQFYQRCMQFAGPLMAKGVEDTLMYTYDRFIGHNEVGDTPETFGLAVRDFHDEMVDRQQYWPLAINATATHDTKRGEGARARLNVLTDIADEWISTVKRWQKMNEAYKTDGIPDANDEYLLYQSIIGSYPMPGQNDDDFLHRLEEYLIKGLREAKLHTQWAEPNEAYEENCKTFVQAILKPGTEFLESFLPFFTKVADYGIINSLTQTILKFTTPGVPDVYQGCELWDLSMVDPDNRRAVDYGLRADNLEAITNKKISFDELWETRYNANIKLWLTNLLFLERKSNANAFEKGTYLPLKVKGKYKQNVLAFARYTNDDWFITIVPLHLAQLDLDITKPSIFNWGNTRVELPAQAPMQWQNIAGGKQATYIDDVKVQSAFEEMPFVILKSVKTPNKRGAGVLMHITSLPSAFGVGDMGPEAIKFVDVLHRTKQKYWQMLPFSPVDAQMFYSPYSSRSGMAGNVLFISPELLVKEGLLDAKEVDKYKLIHDSKADFKEAAGIRKTLLSKAWKKFNEKGEQTDFHLFKDNEAYWLDDFALYEVLKEEYHNKAWFNWPDEFKHRHKKALKKFVADNADRIDFIKWQQWVFAKQWSALKQYANEHNTKLYGDVPFYVSHDSVDVWTNPGIFKLDKDGNMKFVAGVPPDYFNADGQLWGMPVFNWDALEKTGYQWWINRIRRNMDHFDLIRLDHFRAFSEYWEVPAGNTTTINGTWQPGPGAKLFKAFKQQFGRLPFVAEDLGEITPDVYQLRDEFKLPGMKILQFAFGNDMPASVHAPHNHQANAVVYTGTHDNNTLQGWYREESNEGDRRQIEKYINQKIKANNVHKTLVKLCYSSAADVAIVPVQDLLGYDESSRMNTPSSTNSNWTWRLPKKAFTPKTEKWMLKWLKFYNRV